MKNLMKTSHLVYELHLKSFFVSNLWGAVHNVIKGAAPPLRQTNGASRDQQQNLFCYWRGVAH